MAIRNKYNFYGGLFFILLSYLPFSYVNYAKRITPGNCERFIAPIKSFSKTFHKGKQDGWKIAFDSVEFSLSISGEYFEALDKDAFNEMIKPGSTIEVWTLKPDYYGLLNKINNIFNDREAMAVKCNGRDILTIENVRRHLANLFLVNLVLGIVFLLGGLFLSIKAITGLPYGIV